MKPASGSIALVDRRSGKQFYVVFRSNGRQVRRKLGPAWTQGGRPPQGHYTRRMAEAELRAILTDADRGTLAATNRPGGKTFGDACAEYLRYLDEKQRAPSTITDYKRTIHSVLEPEFGKDTPLEEITTARIDGWREQLLDEGRLSRRTVQKYMAAMHSILKRSKRRGWIATNPAENAERITLSRSGDFNVLQPAEVEALARAAESDQDAAIFTVAAFSGLRLGELRALRWRDVDFAKQTIVVRRNYTAGAERVPKSGKVRSVPLIDRAARALDGLSRRERFSAPDDLVFANDVGEYMYDDALRDRFYAALDRAGLKRLRLHDLRHSFGSLAVQAWPLSDVKAYMGHADLATTMIYIHHRPRARAADELTAVIDAAETVSQTVSQTEDFEGNSAQLSEPNDA